MVKIKKDFRLDEETLYMMDTLLPFISAEKSIKMNRTSLIEMLITERYESYFSGARKKFNESK